MNEVKVLDKGFVRLVDHLGNDQRIVQAARVSYGEGTKTVREDRALIRYLVRNAHTSPLEMVQFTFHLKMPLVVARQHFRHRTAKANELSGRYSVMKDEFYCPELDRMQQQAVHNKQGSSTELVDCADTLQQEMENEQRAAYEQYQRYLSYGLSRELARINLPLSLYTELYWTMDLHNLLHYLKLRLDHHAQHEIRVYAQAMLDLIRPIVPFTVEAFEDYIQGSVQLSRAEWEYVREQMGRITIADREGEDWERLVRQLSKNELTEFERKFE